MPCMHLSFSKDQSQMFLACFWPLEPLCSPPFVGNTCLSALDLCFEFLNFIVSHYSPIECLPKYVLYLNVAQLCRKVWFLVAVYQLEVQCDPRAQSKCLQMCPANVKGVRRQQLSDGKVPPACNIVLTTIFLWCYGFPQNFQRAGLDQSHLCCLRGLWGIPLETVNIPIGLITNCFSPGSVCFLSKRKINSRLNFGPHVRETWLSSLVKRVGSWAGAGVGVEHMERWSSGGRGHIR